MLVMTSSNRLKNLSRRASRRFFEMRDNPLEFWRGYRYGQSFRDSNQPPNGSAQANWLEEYFDELKNGPGLWKWRHYFPIYDRHFSKFRNREVHILEIGIFSGGSIGMWHAYFGDQTHVYGVDIEPACRIYEGPKTRVFIGDQSDKRFWQEVIQEVPNLDIVVDDGGHQPFQQIVTLEALLPHLQPGGVYLCEDVHGNFNSFHSYIDGLSRTLQASRMEGDELEVSANEIQQSIDSVHRYPFVTVIEKRAKRLDKMSAPKHGTEWQPFLGVPLPEPQRE